MTPDDNAMPSSRNLVIGLPGRNPETLDWMKDLLREAVPEFDHRILAYRHWFHEQLAPSVDNEADSLAGTNNGLAIAKSFGTLVLLHAFKQLQFRVGRAILIGFPLRHASEAQCEILKAFAQRTPTLIIQQSQDFVGPFSELRRLIAGIAQAVEVAGSDHEYQHIDQLAACIREFVHG